jgi:dienelactone hydrolase
MTSLPPGECCTTGITHEGVPKGSIETIGKGETSYSIDLSASEYAILILPVPTYFSHPNKPNGRAILIFSDIFGHMYPNIQLMADKFSAQGYLVAVPDLFHGDPVVPDAFYGGKIDLPEWLKNHGTSSVDPVADVLVDHLKNTLKIEKLAGVGYCFGAKVCIHYGLDKED